MQVVVTGDSLKESVLVRRVRPSSAAHMSDRPEWGDNAGLVQFAVAMHLEEDVDIYAVDYAKLNNWFPADCFISPEERFEARRYAGPVEGQRYLLSRGFMRELLASYCGAHPSQISYDEERDGRKLLHNDPAIKFCVAYGRRAFVIAISRQRDIGIGLSEVVACDTTLAARRFCPDEKTYLASLLPSDRVLEFYTMQSAKQAYRQCYGIGAPQQINLCPGPKTLEAKLWEWGLHPFRLSDGAQLVVAVRPDILFGGSVALPC